TKGGGAPIVSSWTGRFVAQIGNLLCRGLATRWSFRSIPARADCQSAKQPTASRRYSMAPFMVPIRSRSFGIAGFPSTRWGETPSSPDFYPVEISARRSLHPPQYCYGGQVAPPFMAMARTALKCFDAETG